MRTQSRTLVPAIAGVVILAVSGCGSQGGASKGAAGADSSSDSARVGVVYLSGPLAATEKTLAGGINLSAKDVNAAGGVDGKKMTLIKCEDQASVDLSTACVRRFAHDGIKFVVLDTTSANVQVDERLTQQSGMLAMLPASVQTDLTKSSLDLVFRNVLSAGLETGLAVPEIVDQLHPASVAVLGRDDVFGHDAVEHIVSGLKQRQVQVDHTAYFSTDQTDFSDLFAATKAAHPDAVIIEADVTQAGPMAKQAKLAGLTVPLVFGSGAADAALLDSGGSAVVGDYVWTTGPKPNQAYKKFAAHWKSEYGAAPSKLGTDSYNAIQTLARAMSQAHTTSDPKAVAQVMRSTTFSSPVGPIKFDSEGQNTQGTVRLQKVTAKGFVTVQGNR